MNISQTLNEYESRRENAKEVLRQCKRKLDTLKENAFVEPTTTPSSVELWWDMSLRYESGAYLLHAYPYYLHLCTFAWIYVNICAYLYTQNIEYIGIYYIFIYIYYICIYIKYTRFRGRDRWFSNRLKFEYTGIHRQ